MIKTFYCWHQDFTLSFNGNSKYCSNNISRLIAYIFCYSSWSSPPVRDKSRTPHKAMICACVRHYNLAVEGKILFTDRCWHQDFTLSLNRNRAQITQTGLIAYISCYSSLSFPQVHDKSSTPQKVMTCACVRHYATPALT